MESVTDDKLLSNIELNNYSQILIHADSTDDSLYKTLFGLLANRAISYFSSSDYELADLGQEKLINPKVYLIGTDNFLNIKINPDLSAFNKVMWLYQKLISVNSKAGNPYALVGVDLLRLKFVFSNVEHNELNEEKYLDILNNMSVKFSNHPVYVEIVYELANQYYISGNRYSTELYPKLKDNYVKADSVCRSAIDRFPTYEKTNMCRNLSEKINNVSFKISLPVAQSPGMATLGNIEFRNIEKVYFRIVKGNGKDIINRYNLKDYIQRDLSKIPVAEWQKELPKTVDHRQHSVDFKIPELKAGFYIIYVSNDPEFSTANIIHYTSLMVSELSYIINQNPTGEFNDLYVLNRESGKPEKMVEVVLYTQKYDNRSRSYSINKISTIQTDQFGYTQVKPLTGNNYGTFLIEFVKNGDTLYSENYINFFRHQPSEKPQVKTYFFADRAIYRPGQTIYFKGIVIQKLRDELSLLSAKKTEIDIINPSGKKIETLQFTTDEMGSFNGSFVIPTGMLNGNLSFRTRTGSIGVKVE